MKNKRRLVSVPEDEWKHLKRIAVDDDSTLSKVLTTAVREYIAKQARKARKKELVAAQ